MTDQAPANPQRLALLSGTRWIPKLQLRLAALALTAMMLVTVADVVLRYSFNSPIRGSYDFVEAMLVIFVFNGLSAGFYERKYIVIDLIDHLGPPLLRNALVKIADLICAATLLLLGWAMIRPALQAYAYGDTKIELGLPVYILWIAAAAGMLGTFLCAVAALILQPGVASHGAK